MYASYNNASLSLCQHVYLRCVHQNSSRVAGTAKEREEVYANDWKESGLWHCTVMGGDDTR